VAAPGPGTIDDLLKDARRAEYEASRRLVTDWVSLGLLDSPTRRGVGRGKGTTKGIYSANQRQLLMTLLQHRARGSRIAELSNIPVALWLYWGDTYVPLRQTKRALNTWIQAADRSAQTRSRGAASELVDQLATPDTHDTDRNRLQRLLHEANQTGYVNDPITLQKAIEVVFDPNHTGRTLGPPGASISPEILVREFVLRSRALIALRADRLKTDGVSDQIVSDQIVSDQIFEGARTDLRQQLIAYTRDRPQLIADADASVQHLFDAPLAQQVIPNACRDLLAAIGHQLAQKNNHDH
jgi:hypothetical protein